MLELLTPNLKTQRSLLVAFGCVLITASVSTAQPPGSGGQGGPGGPSAPDRKIVAEFDTDGDGILNNDERARAREALKNTPAQGRGFGPPGGGRGRGNREPGKPGPQVNPSDVKNYPDAALYDPTVLRTIFIEFDNKQDWEKELAEFKPTDVEIPAKLIVDGTEYPNVGVSFRGASSFFMIPEGLKRSLNLSMDFIDKKQDLYGHKSLNLLNCNGDASMMSSALYSHIAGQKIATPKVNFVKVVINGESWGIYSNAEQFNQDFLDENFKTKKGARWKVSGSPRGDGGLKYLGENIEPYHERFEIKSKDDEKSWRDLIHLCKVIDETSADELAAALEPILDVDGALWFLAVDVALVNSDGYWTRASDYSIYQDPTGKFHILPHDMNESFRGSRGGGPGGPGGGGRGDRGGRPGFGPPSPEGPPPGGGPQGDEPPRGNGPPGDRPSNGQGPDGPPPQENRGFRGLFGGGGPGGPGGGPGGPGGFGEGGVDLDPLVGLDSPRMPLRSKLLSIPKLQTRYLQYLRVIAADLLNWENLGPQVIQMRELIAADVAADTRKLMSEEAFQNATRDASPAQPGSLREFAEKRCAYLLNYDKIKSLPAETIELNRLEPKSKSKKKNVSAAK